MRSIQLRLSILLLAPAFIFVLFHQSYAEEVPASPRRFVSRKLLLEMSMWLEYKLVMGEGLLEIAPDGRSVAYAYKGNEAGKNVVCANGKEYGPYEHVGALKFSPDLKKLAYVISDKDGGNMRVVVNGKAGKKYDSINEASILFSPDSKRLTYVAYVKGKQSIIIDGEREGNYSSIYLGSFVFSPDSRRYAYLCQNDGLWQIAVDGVVRKDRVLWGGFLSGLLGDGDASQPVFSPDSKHVTYDVTYFAFTTSALSQRRKTFSFVDGDKLGGDFRVFSPNGKAAYISSDKQGRQSVALNGLFKKKGKTYNGTFHSVTFSPDGKKVAYAVAETEGAFVVSDTAEGKKYRSVVEDSLVFSPDGERLAYVARDTSNRPFLVLDGQEQRQYELYWWSSAISPPLFSPDGKRVAYIAREPETGRHFVVSGSNAGNKYSSIRSLTFSPDSAHLAYIAQGDHDSVVIDGREGSETKIISDLFFDSPNKLHYLAESDKAVFLIEEKVE
jgi:Tol biopolymer transport system component